MTRTMGGGVIVVVPDGIPDSESGVRTWNISTEYDEDYGWRCDPDREQYGETECHTSCEGWCNPKYGCTAGTTCYNDLAFIEQLIDILIEERREGQIIIASSPSSTSILR